MKWEKLRPEGCSPGPRSNMSMFASGKKIFFFGGVDPQGKLRYDLFSYEICRYLYGKENKVYF